MSASTQPAIPTQAGRLRRRRLPIAVGLALLAIGVPIAVWLWFHWANERGLAEALAETERLDPHWRFADILAGRAKVPDDENASLQVEVAMNASGKLHDVFRKHLPDGDFDALHELPRTARLGDPQLALLRNLSVNCPEALAEARKLAAMHRGRPRITYSKDFVGTIIEPVQDARTVCTLLYCDAVLRGEEGDVAGAMESCRAMLNTARSIGDEPFVIAVLVRAACTHMTIDALERVLARGDPGEPALGQMQAALEQEQAEPILLFALRGERAGLYETLLLMEEGKIRASHLAAMTGQRVGGVRLFMEDRLPSRTTADRAALLRGMNALVEAAKLPVEKQSDAFALGLEEWKGWEASPILGRQWFNKSLDSHLRVQANLRCTIAALAAERYRVKDGAWPTSLDALVKAGLLNEVPLDPFDAAPLRFKRIADGLVIYSIGPDRTDDGGKINRGHEPPAGTDQGFRLWDGVEGRPQVR
jgi:hypothetical protein